MASFHNSVKLTGSNLAKAELAAKTQEEKVLLFFKQRPWSAFSPSRVHKLMLMEGLIAETVPITSIRRALTNLTEENKLEQTGDQVDGPLGKPEHVWKLKKSRRIKNMPIQAKLF